MRACLFAAAVIAALACNVRDGLSAPTPAAVPSGVGPVQYLQANDLSLNAQPKGALALLSGVTYEQASLSCAALSETLLDLSTFSAADTAALQANLRYLTKQPSLSTATFWVKQNNACQVITGSTGQTGSTVASRSPKKKKKHPKHPKHPSGHPSSGGTGAGTGAGGTNSTGGTGGVATCTGLRYALCTSTAPVTTDVSKNTAPSDNFSLTVTTPDGLTLKGTRDARSFRFLGVPFADAPVGALRFAAPRAYSGSRNIDATRQRSTCPQPLSPFGTTTGTDVSEDCLFLNIYTPYVPSSSSSSTPQPLKPVAFYVYGGAFYTGNAALIDYDGQNFASRNDVVVVTINYRIGALGNLATKTLLNGNQNIQDQVMALQWVRDRIAAFGGDPSRVTIFGQSAGGQSVVALLSSSKAKGLFSAAIAQSAPIDLPWFSRDLYANTITPNTAAAVGCTRASEQDMVDCLRSVPYADLVADTTQQMAATKLNAAVIGPNYFKASVALAMIEPYLPIVGDGPTQGFIDDQFVKLLAAGTLPNKVPTMFTETNDEASAYIDPIVPTSLGNSNAALVASFAVGYSPAEATAMATSGQFTTDPNDPDSVRNTLARTLTQSEWLCAHGYLLDRYKQQFPQLWHTIFERGHVQGMDSSFGSPKCQSQFVCHTADVLPIFGTLNVKTQASFPIQSDEEVRFFQVVHDAWAAFFRTHTPTPAQDYLVTRGSSFDATRQYYYGNNAVPFQTYVNHDNVNIFSSASTLQHHTPQHQGQCQSFFDGYGYTYQRV